MTYQDSTATPTSVYRYFDRNELLIYVGVTSRGMVRNHEHNATKEWWPFVAKQEVSHHATRAEALAVEKGLIQRHIPPFNKHHNPYHEQARRSYLQIAAALEATRTSQAIRRTKRSRLPLRALDTPMPGHDLTLYSSPLDADATGGNLMKQATMPFVSTPQRKRSGVVTDLQYRSGVLLVGVAGRYLPERVDAAKAVLGIQTKPPAFYVKSIMLNDGNDLNGGK